MNKEDEQFEKLMDKLTDPNPRYQNGIELTKWGEEGTNNLGLNIEDNIICFYGEWPKHLLEDLSMNLKNLSKQVNEMKNMSNKKLNECWENMPNG